MNNIFLLNLFLEKRNLLQSSIVILMILIKYIKNVSKYLYFQLYKNINRIIIDYMKNISINCIFISITASSEELFDSLIGSSPEKQPKAIVAFSEESSSTISPQTKGKIFNIFNIIIII